MKNVEKVGGKRKRIAKKYLTFSTTWFIDSSKVLILENKKSCKRM
jgi:hypothetical protein